MLPPGGAFLSGGTGAYSNVCEGLAWGRFSAEGRAKTASSRAPTIDSRGPYCLES